MTGAPGKGPRPRLLAGLVLLVAILVGGIAGVAADRLLLRSGMHRGFGHHGPAGPTRDRDFRKRFARELDLSPEQQSQIDSIMDREGRELQAVRGQVQPSIDSIIGRTRRALDSVLTPEQRKKADEMRRRHPPLRRRFPREDMGRPPPR